MRSIPAVSLAPAVKDWLANSHRPRILHVFDRACNLINEHREILSIVTPQIDNGPFNLVLGELACFSDHVHLGSPICISAGHIDLGDLLIGIANAKLWNPRPDWETLHAKRNNILIQIMSFRAFREQSHYEADDRFEQCFDYGSPQAFAPSLRANTAHTITETTNYRLPISNSLISNLSLSLANKDTSAVKDIAAKLAGLGSGLTPSGDDILVGAIYAAWIIHPPKIANVLAQEIVDVAAPLTTSLSTAWLMSGGRGEAGILWHELFNVLFSADLPAIGLQMTKLLSVGHTSGADALTGFLRTIMSSRKSP